MLTILDGLTDSGGCPHLAPVLAELNAHALSENPSEGATLADSLHSMIRHPSCTPEVTSVLLENCVMGWIGGLSVETRRQMRSYLDQLDQLDESEAANA
jgi:hypothetical protein